MSDNIVEITQTSDYIISIDTSLVQNDNNVDVTVSSPNIVDVINNTTVLISDLPPGYPISSTSGYLPISRVSGLDILAGTGIGVINNSGLYTISVTGTFGLTGEQVDDRISNLLVAGNYINISYNDNLDSLTISASGLQPSGNYSLVGHSHIISDISGLQTQLDSKQPSGVYASGIHTHTSSQIIDFNEAVDDRIGSGLFVSGSGINLIYNDTSNSFTVSASGLINNPANNRILTSRDTTTINIDAESNLTFDGTSLVVSGDARVDNIKFDGNTISTISGNISINPFSSGSIQRGLITSVPGFIRGPYAVDFGFASSSGQVASGPYSAICGGIGNKASHSFAIAVGGNQNSAISPYSSVVGGIDNTSAGTYNFIGGGQNNTCSGPYSASILGGRNNTTSGYYSTIGGGANNNSAGRSSVVAGGGGNTSSAYYSTIGGGYANTASNFYSTVAGGQFNTVGGTHSVIAGGQSNTVLGNFSAILAGSYNNDNSFNNVFILGSNITATQANTTYTENLISQSGKFTNLTVNNTGVSLMGHTHTSINITDFNSSVSGLLPVKNITSGSGIGISLVSGNFTVSVTGTFGLTGEQVDDRVNDLLKAGSYINLNYNDIGDALTISVTGLQPSGNYSVVGHTHTSSNITDFNTAVSGLIPPSSFTSLSGISGITVSNSGTNYTVSLTDPTIQLVDITDLSNNAQTFLLTPSSNNLSSLINDETGSGLLVFNNSPSFSGIPTAPTASSGTNTNQIASTSFVRTEISNLVNSAPSTLDTLNELATALGNDPNFATTVTNLIGSKVSKSGDTMTGALIISPTGASPSGLIISPGSETNLQNTLAIDVNNYLTITNVAGGLIATEDSSIERWIISQCEINGGSGNFASLKVNNTGVSVNGHSHSSSDITNFNTSVSGLLPSVSGSGFVNSSFANNTYTISVNGLQPSGNYSIVGHSHLSSDITDFNSSVSGLLTVKNIVSGSGISVSSLSGVYTIATTGSFGLTTEEVDDRVSQLLVAGTGVNITYNDPSGSLRIDNLHTEINALSKEPQGFVNRNDSVLSFNDSTRTFTIQPAVSGGFYTIYAEGIKVVKNTVESVVIGSGTALNYIHFNTTAPYSLHYKTTGFDFDTDIPVAFIHWNSDINQSTFFGEERHGIRMDSVTHKWIHNTFGMQYISGLSIGGYTLLGNGTSNSHAQIDISDGVLYQEDIVVNITNGTGVGSFVQQLNPIAYIPVYYHSGSTGQWVRDIATTFPLKYNGTRAQYNLYSGGTWTTPNVTNNRYFAIWIVATNDINDPILAILGQREDASLGAAESNNNWTDINLTNIPTRELRPLYRLIFITNDTFTNTPKSSLQSILDIRVAIQSTVAGVVQNDHGSLFGLIDDDHPQYVHINNARTIDAVHTFQNGITFDGSGTQTVPYIPSSVNITGGSGNFNSLSVNGTGVSISGHAHTSSDITDFNSSVSGLVSGIYQPLLTNPVTGVGTSGYLSRWNGTNSVTSGIIFDNGSRIGINNPAPSSVLDVIGESRIQGLLYFNQNSTDANDSSRNRCSITREGGQQLILRGGSNSLNLSGDGGKIIIRSSTVGTEIGGDGANTYVSFHPGSNVEKARITPSGFLGIGTTTPSGQLHVIGTGIVSSRLGIGTNSPQYSLDVSGSGNFNNVLISGIPLNEVIDDEVANLLVAGSGISLNYNDSANTLTVDSNVSTSLVAGNGVNLDYNVTTDTLSINVIHPFLLMGG